MSDEGNLIDKGILVIVGEYGCFGGNKTREVRQQWTLDVANAAYSRGACPILWDTPGGEFNRYRAIYDRPEFIEELVSIAE